MPARRRTGIRAFRNAGGLDQFQGRASVRAWLYRIATDRSLDALRARRRRPEDQRMTQMSEPTRWNDPVWLEPYPDVLLEGIPDEAPGPEARYETKETIALAFIVGLQHLSPQQRAVLVLRDVLVVPVGGKPLLHRPLPLDGPRIPRAIA
jgi:RNA polymerase sigma-70 factor (ECF subfamily)